MHSICLHQLRPSFLHRQCILWKGIIQHNTSGILSRKGDGIDKPAGLTGKTYSTWDSPIELAVLENVVNGDGGDFSQVTLIPNDITDEPAALAANQTDAIWVFQGWGGINADVEGVDCDYFAFSDINPVLSPSMRICAASSGFSAANSYPFAVASINAFA